MARVNPGRDSAGPPITLIAAVARNGGIGRKGAMLFRLKDDLRHFRQATLGRPVIMGRTTWESLPARPLEGRANIVLTRNASLLAPGAFVCSSGAMALQAAAAMAAHLQADRICVIGGAEIYRLFLPLAGRMLLTQVDSEAEADAFFPAYRLADWREISARAHVRDAHNAADFVIRELARQGG